MPTRFLNLPENRSAVLAVQELVAHLAEDRISGQFHPLFLHGPTGSGKSTLIRWLQQECHQLLRGRTLLTVPANDWPLPEPEEENADPLRPLRQVDLLIVEDIQQLPHSSLREFRELLDHRHARDLASVVTAHRGPGQLEFPATLLGRLAGGLVVGLDSWQASSRLVFLEEAAQRLQLAVAPEILQWLAQHLTSGGRQLEGAVQQLQGLLKHEKRLDLARVQEQFRIQADADRPSMERIVERVSGHFQLDPRLVKSKNRFRKILLPRQISMYLARQLTPLSLEQIGQYFGGRDHSTVLHACRKVEGVLESDVALSGTIRQLYSDLA